MVVRGESSTVWCPALWIPLWTWARLLNVHTWQPERPLPNGYLKMLLGIGPKYFPSKLKALCEHNLPVQTEENLCLSEEQNLAWFPGENAKYMRLFALLETVTTVP